MQRISCNNEWSKLKEVFVGDIEHHLFPLNDYTFEMVYYTNLKTQSYRKTSEYKLDKKRLKDRQNDLDNLAKVLESFDIKVRRPNPLTDLETISNNGWTVTKMAPEEPRDIFAIIDNVIIESAPLVRSRIFETQNYYEHFNDMFCENGMNWIKAPMPRLHQNNLDEEALKDWTSYNEVNWDNSYYDLAFDCANFIKLGKDILYNVGTKNARKGLEWLRRQFPNKVIWEVNICDDHIDGCLAPLCEGVFLCNPWHMSVKEYKERLPEQFTNWKFIEICEEELTEEYTEEEIQIATDQGMWMNVLSIDEKRILIQDDAVNTIKRLQENGFEPIPIKFRHGRLFSGGIHCCTVDIWRVDD